LLVPFCQRGKRSHAFCLVAVAGAMPQEYYDAIIGAVGAENTKRGNFSPMLTWSFGPERVGYGASVNQKRHQKQL
jgi:hypothetical protein